MEVALGIWQGVYQEMELLWLRWGNTQDNLLPTGTERAEQPRQILAQEQQQAEQEQQRAPMAEERAAQRAARLRAMGINPDQPE